MNNLFENKVCLRVSTPIMDGKSTATIGISVDRTAYKKLQVKHNFPILHKNNMIHVNYEEYKRITNLISKIL